MIATCNQSTEWSCLDTSYHPAEAETRSMIVCQQSTLRSINANNNVAISSPFFSTSTSSLCCFFQYHRPDTFFSTSASTVVDIAIYITYLPHLNRRLSEPTATRNGDGIQDIHMYNVRASRPTLSSLSNMFVYMHRHESTAGS